MRFRAFILFVLALAACGSARGESTPGKEGIEFFEKNIRPVLVQRCYECHSAQAKKVKGKLLLDSRAGVAKGGESGAVVVPGDVEKSRLITAIRWRDSDLTMPPKEQLSAAEIAHFEEWVKMGAPDPRTDTPVVAAAKTIDLAAGRKWWAFQPVNELPSPAAGQQGWTKKKIDGFVLAELEAKKLSPSPEADARTLIERAYLDLVGIRPTYEQSEAFAKDPSDAAYAKIVDGLLASPLYGQRWGRYWLDVARYAEDNPTGEATTPPYPFAWRYRDWVIEALNRDVPYDRFVSLQLAADVMPRTPRSDFAATSFLGTGPVYHKDGRLSKDVIENLYMDDFDERVDVVSRGILGLTVACARCHDHKFDPIASRDYYALAGVFASTAPVPRPTEEIDPQLEKRFMVAAPRLFYLSYAANLLRGDPGSKPKEAREKVGRFNKEMDAIMEGFGDIQQSHPELYNHLAQLAKRADPYPGERPVAAAKAAVNNFAGGGRRRRGGNSNEPFFNSVYEAGTWVNGSDPDLTMIDIRPGEAHDLHVLPGGNVTKPGALAPRGFISVLSKGDPAFHQGSGRAELAKKIFTDAAPLAARVMVNRVWAWHFGKGIVETPSDFGVQGERPTHPKLLDDLAARFIASGWSLKWLHREIMLSAVYRQASHPREDAMKVDPGNRLLWRMNSRRLDIEAYRDCLLQAAGTLDTSLGGPSSELEQNFNHRRTVYARIRRGRVSNLLQLFDFPEPMMHSPGRETVTSPLQQLFVMNSPFMRDQAMALVRRVGSEGDVNTKVRSLYRKVLARDPTAHELELANEYLASGSMTDYAHALLSTNEVIFWP
jgi:hypothetical protein